jgi:pyruvate kinase
MTRTGNTAKILSYFHPECPVIAATIEPMGRRQLNLIWGVTPIDAEDLTSADSFVEYAVAKARESRIVKKGEKIIVILSSSVGGDNDTMRICTV